MINKVFRVLVVSSKYPPEYAGSGLRAHNTYKRFLEKFPIKFEVLSSSVVYNQNKEYEIDGIKVTRIARKPFPGAKALRERGGNLFSRLIEKIKHECNYWSESLLTWKYLMANNKKFDLIHVFGRNWVTAATITFAKITGKPLIIELCNDMPNPHQYEPLLFSIILGRRFPSGTTIVCISDMLKRLCEKYGYKENVWSRPNPVDEKKFFIDTENKIGLRGKYTPFGAEDILLVYVAYFTPGKNQIFLLDVMKILPERYKLVLAGPIIEKGPLADRDRKYLEEIKKKISHYHLEGRIQLETRFIDNVDKYLKMSDVFLFPTKTEALGTPMLEAISCGIPVVANRLPGVTDYWIKDGKNGYLSELNAEEFSEKIKKAAEIDPVTLRNAREELIIQCSTEVIDKGYFDLLKKVTARA